MKRSLIVTAVVLFAFAGGYVLGDGHKPKPYLEEDAVNLFLTDQLLSNLQSPTVHQAQYSPAQGKAKQKSDRDVLQEEYEKFRKEYEKLNPQNVMEKPGKPWTVCGDSQSKISVTYKLFPDRLEDTITFDTIK